ncbi:MAG: hypothetical protein HIU89_02485 [Proteobacteria bacterium]|nr:hypothetical protein [Pseudomonadota bacterium]
MRKAVPAASLLALDASGLTGSDAVAGMSHDIKAVGKTMHKAADMAK